MIRDNGFEVLEAADGAEALAVFTREVDRIDLVLTDVMMPRMNGTELGEQLALLSPALPVIFMSGYVGDPLVENVARSGNSFLRKPFTKQTLMNTLHRSLDRSSRRAAG
jgi:CheY-like chemotaxis protein